MYLVGSNLKLRTAAAGGGVERPAAAMLQVAPPPAAAVRSFRLEPTRYIELVVMLYSCSTAYTLRKLVCCSVGAGGWAG